ncbi:hypothetical protein niasHT_016142 [Heterodera trifolii]|uniref:Uncharacterized protein n=1 Tax=Heterodera trifolii TaxID=157864 RepID=A0ABD2LIH9_9BILA
MFKFTKPMTTTAARMIVRKSRLEVMPMAKKVALLENHVQNKCGKNQISKSKKKNWDYIFLKLKKNVVSPQFSLNRVTELTRGYLVSHLADFKEDPYALTLCTYVLHLANSPKKGDVLKMLEGLQTTGTTDGMVHWTKKVSNGAKDGTGGAAKNDGGVARDTNQYFFQPQPADVQDRFHWHLRGFLLRYLGGMKADLGGVKADLGVLKYDMFSMKVELKK